MTALATAASPAVVGVAPRLVAELLHLAGQERGPVRRAIADAACRERLIDAFVDVELLRMLQERDRRQALAERQAAYEGAQTRLWAARSERGAADLAAELAGPFALLEAGEAFSPSAGRLAELCARAHADIAPGGGDDALTAALTNALGLSAEGAGPNHHVLREEPWI